ncbi:unnamed protein product [Linum tenue]|uniref:Prolamin-like domain-containing protein n=1 Tax=Linum tenue TaxID=586396 RepID=A0AAV0HWG0_9ROSI|nr:unnamed protein product [Linum tenue]
MAPKATSLVFILALAVTLSTIAESRNLKPAEQSPEECYAAIFKFPSCLFEIIGAAQGGAGGSVQISAPCCSAFTSLTQDCQFQFSGNLLPVIQKSCGAAVGGPTGEVPPSPPAPPTELGPAAAPV